MFSGIEINHFFDGIDNNENHPLRNQPYFYCITWTKNSIEYGGNHSFAFGVYSDFVDHFEPNDDVPYAREVLLNSYVVSSGCYSFNDGAGGIADDTDWYKCRISTDYTLSVTVRFPQDTVFLPGELRFQFYYNGKFVGPPDSFISYTETFVFDNYGDIPGDVDVYFVLYPITDESRVSSYTLSAGNEF